MVAVMIRMTWTKRTTAQRRILCLRMAGLCLGLIAITSFLVGMIMASGAESARPWTLVGYPALFGCLGCAYLLRRLASRRDDCSLQRDEAH